MPSAQLSTGVTLHWERSGIVQDEPLLFVNGLTMDTASWDPLADILGSEYSVIRYDCRGQGASDKPAGPYLTLQHAVDLVALLDHLELDRVHLVGLSNGGLVSMMVAGELAATQPQRIASLTVIDSFAEVDTVLSLILDSWRKAIEAGGSALRFDVATPWVWGHEFLAAHREDVMALREKAAAADPAVVTALIDGLLDFGQAYRSVAAYDGPMLALVGADDVLTPPRYSEKIVEYAKYGRLQLLPGSGHAAPIERPSHVADAIRAFLATQETSGQEPAPTERTAAMAPTDLETRTTDVAGSPVAYWNAGEGHPVVFVHGNFASKRWFRSQFEHRLEGFRYLAPDLPNFGESGPLGDEATLDRYAAALESFLDRLEVDRFVLVGHSLGGGVAQTFAVGQPERVAGLFLVSSPPPSGFETPPGTEEAQRALRASSEQMSAALAATMPTHRPDDYEQIVADALDMPAEVYGPHNRTLAAMDLGDKAERVTCPVLILRCEHDYLITEAMAHELNDTYPNSRLELWDGVGHSPQVEDPERFQTLLAEFLEGIDMT